MREYETLHSFFAFTGAMVWLFVGLAVLAVVVAWVWEAIGDAAKWLRDRSRPKKPVEQAEQGELKPWAAGEVPFEAPKHDWLDGSPSDGQGVAATNSEAK